MKIAYITHYDISDPKKWHPKVIGIRSTSYYKAQSLKSQFPDLEYVGPLEEYRSLILKVKNKIYRRVLKKNYQSWADRAVNQFYGKQIAQKLAKAEFDFVVCPDINLMAYLECDRPIILWTTNPYCTIIDTYPEFSNLCEETSRNLIAMDRLALEKCKLAIFPSEWAANIAIANYNLEPGKVKVVPYGANVECDRATAEIEEIINSRPSQRCKLLFFGVHWQRKGGDVVLKVARQLNQMGLETELTVVGCTPPQGEKLPDFVKVLGFISKGTKEGLESIERVLKESHFLLLPSSAETYGNVLCEANSFGVPCLATVVGGMTTIVKDDVNGKLFATDAKVAEYCTYISEKFSNYDRYKQLAASSFQEYCNRLNWSVAGESLAKILKEL